MTGREYIDGNYITEVSYREAEKCITEQVIRRLQLNNGFYTYGWFIDEPEYPPNAEMYDDFCYDINGESYFDEEELISWAIRVINNHSTKYRIDTGWEDDEWSEVIYLRELTEEEKEELGL